MQSRKRIVKWLIVVVAASCILCVSWGHLNLARKVVCGHGICLSCEGRIDATINGEGGKWRYFIADGKIFSDGEDGASHSRWIVVHDNSRFPFGDLYWLSEDRVLISKSGLWDRLNLFGRWILLSETALHCTYDVRNDMKGLAAEVEVNECGDARRYVCQPSKRHVQVTGNTNVIFSADIPLPLFKGRQ